MHILSEVSRPYHIDSLSAPLGVSHFWTFNGKMLDFKLEELEYLEETLGPTIKIKVHNMEMELPMSWSVIAVDKETYTIDSIPLASCATFEHDILLFSPDDSKLVTAKLSVIDFYDKKGCIHPMIPKDSCMVHPVTTMPHHGKNVFYGIVCGPNDLYRYIGQRTVGDILG